MVPVPNSAGGPVPRLAWEDFRRALVWNQDEHVSLIGTTGSGKTTLALDLLPERKRVVALVTKPHDSTFSGLTNKGWRRVQSWDEVHELDRRVLLWPKFRGVRDVAIQRRAFAEACEALFVQGRCCVYVDEVEYVAKELRMESTLRLLLKQGRSLRLSVVGGTQRPAFVPREVYTEATHVFWWKMADDRDRRTIGGIGAADPTQVRRIVGSLPRHEVLYLNTRSGHMARTMLERG